MDKLFSNSQSKDDSQSLFNAQHVDLTPLYVLRFNLAPPKRIQKNLRGKTPTLFQTFFHKAESKMTIPLETYAPKERSFVSIKIFYLQSNSGHISLLQGWATIPFFTKGNLVAHRQ